MMTDQTQKPITQGDGENVGDTKVVPQDGGAGTDDSGAAGEDADILGKKQEDLDADDLKGDTRSGTGDGTAKDAG